MLGQRRQSQSIMLNAEITANAAPFRTAIGAAPRSAMATPIRRARGAAGSVRKRRPNGAPDRAEGHQPREHLCGGALENIRIIEANPRGWLKTATKRMAARINAQPPNRAAVISAPESGLRSSSVAELSSASGSCSFGSPRPAPRGVAPAWLWGGAGCPISPASPHASRSLARLGFCSF